MQARAYWTTGPGHGQVRPVELPDPGPDEALVRTVCSGVSGGTETLVHRGGVPEAVRDLMRAPYQEGDLPGPVKYGYLSVGVVERGPAGWTGRRVFCLYPHQDRYVVPVDALSPIPDDVPDERAVLAGAVETALNALWDAGPRYGDRLAVIGGGMIGGAVAALARRFPLGRLELVDVDPDRAELAAALGVPFATPHAAAGDCDLVLHCSATAEGLALALDLLGEEGTCWEVSWYGDATPPVPLGGAFHARRLSIRASQVGAVSASRRARRTTRDRLGLALAALADPAFDALLGDRHAFEDLPGVMNELAGGRLAAGCQVIRYDRPADRPFDDPTHDEEPLCSA